MMRNGMTLGILGFLTLITSAFAASPTAPAPGDAANEKREHDDVRFECEFRGHFNNKKEGGWCKVRGQFDGRIPERRRYINGDRDDFLSVECDNHEVFKGSIIYGIFPDRDDSKRSFDTRFLSSEPFTAAISVEDLDWDRFGGPFKANLTVRPHRHHDLDKNKGKGNDMTEYLFGRCHFQRERHAPTLE